MNKWPRKSKTLLLSVVVTMNGFVSFAQNKPVILQNQRELFVDNYLIDKKYNIEERLQTPVSGGVALKFNAPWEGQFCTYITVVNDGSMYRMYYRGLAGYENKGDQQVTCYAESKDGITWTKPNLRLFTVNGTLENNVVMVDNPQKSTHNLAVLYDGREGVPANERYKAVGGESNKNPSSGLFRYVSSDGINWSRFAKDTSALYHDYALDSQNVLAWVPSEGVYAIYLRAWTGGKPGELYPVNGIRSIARSVSKDFVNWSKPEMMQFGNTQLEHLYTNTTHPYFRAPQLLISMPFRFSPKIRVLSEAELKENGTDPTQWNGVADGVLMTSRGGNVYERKFMESFIRPGTEQKNWGARSNIPAMGIIETGAGEMSFFVTRAYGTKDVFIERMKLRTDGFVALHAGYNEGNVITRAAVLRGNTMKVNHATSSVGYVKIVFLDEQGKEIPGFGEADAVPLIGDKIENTVKWKSGKTLRDLGDRKVLIKVIVRDADVYSFAVSDK